MRDERLDDEDDLFSPSLAGVQRRPLAASERPWRLGSQLYVAFFGGPLAAGAIGYLNGGRLGLPLERRLAIAALGAVGLVAAAAVAATFDLREVSPRIVVVVAGVVTYLGTRRLQQDADRRHRAGRVDDDAYGSLWVPGVLTVLASALVSLVVLAPVLA